jgi:probable F420-dependent oxidoreductase
MNPFRFTAQVPDPVLPLGNWQKECARIEALGFDTIAIADHFTGGYEFEPFVALTAVAMQTRLRVQTAVLGVDYRHPVLVHRMAATLDRISEGRLDLGLGAGWMHSDYVAAGIQYDSPGTRIARLAEAIHILKGLFSGEPVSFDGEFYEINDLVGVPRAVQTPHPPLLVGGGGERMLRLAGREADIVGINANLASGDIGKHSVLDVSWEKMSEKVDWARSGAQAAGRDPAGIQLSMAQWLLHVDESRSNNEALLAKLGARLGVDPTWLEDAPGVVVGPVTRCIEKLQELRERLGISYIQLYSGPHSIDLQAAAPVLTALVGT